MMPASFAGTTSNQSNPRRRQRNASEDSVAIRQPIKRRKRTALTENTFESPISPQTNGSSEGGLRHSLPNGLPHQSPTGGPNGANGSNLAIRERTTGRHDQSPRPSKPGREIGLAKNEYYTISKLTSTPDALVHAEPQRPWQVKFSPQTGYAIATTHVEAFVWKYNPSSSLGEHRASRVKIPDSSSSDKGPLPLAMMLPGSPEPSLLLVMPLTGKMVFWDNLSNATSTDENRQRQQSVQDSVTGMMSGESITDITEAEPRAFVLSLSTGRLVHVSLNETHGKANMQVQYIRTGPGPGNGLFGSLRGVFNPSHWKKDVAAVRSAHSKQRGQRYVVTVSSRGTFQIWNMQWSNIHSLSAEIDARANILKSLEDRQVFSPHAYDASFNVLDFAIISQESSSKLSQNVQRSEGGEFEIVLLTVVTGGENQILALIHLTLSGGQSIVHLVRPLRSSPSYAASADHKPILLVPKSEDVAYVAFEKSIIIASLETENTTPDTQLQSENHTLPGPFEDVVHFRKGHSFQVAGCSADFSDHARASSSCTIAVYGYGLIRLSAQPYKAAAVSGTQSAANVHAKLEQAVFFGKSKQGLFDFSPQPGEEYPPEDVARAALSISRAIVDSTSSFVPTVSPSLGQQIDGRVSALATLIDYLRTHFGPLDPQVRWKLLWDAEKMAAAQALWNWYDNSESKDSSTQKELLADLIEAIPESLKDENQPESGQSDGVRHWFVYDIRRIQWVIPYAHEIVEIKFREASEDKEDVDIVARASDVAAAADIQLVTLEAAFHFRQAAFAKYGFNSNDLEDGILKTSEAFKQLSEFWTSACLQDSAALMIRVKELSDLTNQNAKVLAGIVDDYCEQESEAQQEIDLDEVLRVMNNLASKCPRQIELCSQVFVERYRWLQSRNEQTSKDAGDDLAEAFDQLRRQQIFDLVDLNLSDQGVALAEKYHDMEALLDIFQHESAESNGIGPSIPKRVDSYFQRFGSTWADAYFSRSLVDGLNAVQILSSDDSHKAHLTRFLRLHPEFANMAWINEVSTERDYSSAAAFLNKAANQTDNLWARKTMLSLSKLSVQAAVTTEQSSNDNGRVAIQKSTRRQAILSIQEGLYECLEPHLKSSIDIEAAADVAIDHNGIRTVGEKPHLKAQLRESFAKIFKREVLSPIELINTLSLTHEDTVEHEGSAFLSGRFFMAIRVLQLTYALANISLSSPSATMVANVIWRRALIASDWTALSHTETKNDARVHREAAETPLFITLFEGFQFKIGPQEHDFWTILAPPASPSEVVGAGTTVEDWSSLPVEMQFPEENLEEMVKEISSEDVLLQKYIKKGRLNEWYKGVMSSAETEARQSADHQSGQNASKRPPGPSSPTQKTSSNFNVHEDADENGTDGLASDQVDDSDVAMGV